MKKIKKLKFLFIAVIVFTALGLNFQKSNETTTSVANLNIDYFNTEAKADAPEFSEGVSALFTCVCPWGITTNCVCGVIGVN